MSDVSFVKYTFHFQYSCTDIIYNSYKSYEYKL